MHLRTFTYVLEDGHTEVSVRVGHATPETFTPLLMRVVPPTFLVRLVDSIKTDPERSDSDWNHPQSLANKLEPSYQYLRGWFKRVGDAKKEWTKKEEALIGNRGPQKRRIILDDPELELEIRRSFKVRVENELFFEFHELLPDVTDDSSFHLHSPNFKASAMLRYLVELLGRYYGKYEIYDGMLSLKNALKRANDDQTRYEVLCMAMLMNRDYKESRGFLQAFTLPNALVEMVERWLNALGWWVFGEGMNPLGWEKQILVERLPQRLMKYTFFHLPLIETESLLILEIPAPPPLQSTSVSPPPPQLSPSTPPPSLEKGPKITLVTTSDKRGGGSLFTMIAGMDRYPIFGPPEEPLLPPDRLEELITKTNNREDVCAYCSKHGELLLCDTCIRVYHWKCWRRRNVGAPKDPPDMFICGNCELPLDAPLPENEKDDEGDSIEDDEEDEEDEEDEDEYEMDSFIDPDEEEDERFEVTLRQFQQARVEWEELMQEYMELSRKPTPSLTEQEVARLEELSLMQAGKGQRAPPIATLFTLVDPNQFEQAEQAFGAPVAVASTPAAAPAAAAPVHILQPKRRVPLNQG